MKTKRNSFFIFLIIIAIKVSAQQGINYKAIINEDTGSLLANTAITIQFTILENGTTLVYSETHTTTTDASGILIVNIGEGTGLSGDFNTIDWSGDPLYLKTEIDKGEGFVDMGTTEFKTVPYAMHARTSGSRLPVYTSAEIDELSPNTGDAVFNITEKLYQIYDGNSWQVFNSDCWPKPTVANAGPDQNISNGTTTAMLTANPPDVGHGTAEWTIVSGEGGTTSNLTDPHATFTGVLNESYTLRWTISTSCGISEDEVKLRFYQEGSGPNLSDIDGNSYSTVFIGDQLWMAENLKTTKYCDGTSIPLVTSIPSWVWLNTPAYCWYNNDRANYINIYGALYNWYTVNTGKLCPTGWHVPTLDEWIEMEDYLVANGYYVFILEGLDGIAKSLATDFGWTSSTNSGAIGNTDYTDKQNATGFSALPGGYRSGNDGIFSNVGNSGYWWTSSENSTTDKGWGKDMSYDLFHVDYGAKEKRHGYSVRCIRD